MEDEDDDEDNEDENEQRLYQTSKATTTATTASTTPTTTTYRARRLVSCLAIIGQQQEITCSSRCDQMGARCPSHMRLASRQTDNKQASKVDDISQTRTPR